MRGVYENQERDETGLQRFGKRKEKGEVRRHHPPGNFPFCQYGLIF